MSTERVNKNLDQTTPPKQIEILTELDFNPENFQKLLEENDSLKRENSELNLELIKAKNESLIDPLTKCLNLRYLNMFLTEHFNPEHPEYDHNKTAFVYIDINGLGSTNNEFGHDAGDLLLQMAARYFKESFHEKDIVVRIYGDEFVIICENYNNDPDFEDKLRAKVKKIMERAKEVIINFKGNLIQLRYSAGTAAYNMKIDKNAKAVCNRAEIEMFINKGLAEDRINQ